MGLIVLALVCAMAGNAPDRVEGCKLVTLDRVEGLTACTMLSQGEAAAWAEQHPGYVVREVRCVAEGAAQKGT